MRGRVLSDQGQDVVGVCASAGILPWCSGLNQGKRSRFVMTIVRFVRQEQGQDLVEYTLLLAFVAWSSAALFISGGANTAGIWSVVNTILSNANVAAS